jgi:hypothetical protein
MYPKPIPPCFALNHLCIHYDVLIGVMFTSLKVVNMAVSFWQANLSATLRRNIDNFVRSVPRLPPVGL